MVVHGNFLRSYLLSCFGHLMSAIKSKGKDTMAMNMKYYFFFMSIQGVLIFFGRTVATKDFL